MRLRFAVGEEALRFSYFQTCVSPCCGFCEPADVAEGEVGEVGSSRCFPVPSTGDFGWSPPPLRAFSMAAALAATETREANEGLPLNGNWEGGTGSWKAFTTRIWKTQRGNTLSLQQSQPAQHRHHSAHHLWCYHQADNKWCTDSNNTASRLPDD